MKRLIRDFLNLRRRERRGTMVLATILVMELVYLSVRQYQSPEAIHDFAAFEDQIDAFLQKDPLDLAAEGFRVELESESFPFNPNKLPIEDWVALGLTESQARSIHNYEAKGGAFRKKSDVARMYAIDSALFARLEPFIEIPDSMRRRHRHETYTLKYPAKRNFHREYQRDSSYQPRFVPKEKVVISMNFADTTEWQTLSGIGPAFARRIVRFRDDLGGFITKDQLKEVYGFPEETFDRLGEQILFESVKVIQIDVNQAPVEEFANHPYLSWNVARSLVAIREQHGPYARTEDITRSDLVDEDLYRKIAAYLKVSENASEPD